MQNLSLLPAILFCAGPAAAQEIPFSRLSGSAALQSESPPEAVPCPAEGQEMPGLPDSVAFLIKPEAGHSQDARLYFPFESAGKSAGQDFSLADADDGEEIPYLEIAEAEAQAQGVDLALVLAVIQKESMFDPGARSSAGALGLMQITPATAKWLGLKETKKLRTPEVNIKYGVKYLKYLWETFSETNPSDLSYSELQQKTSQMALAAYNSGPGNVRKYDGVPPFKETRYYVKKVTEYFALYEEKLKKNIPVP